MQNTKNLTIKLRIIYVAVDLLTTATAFFIFNVLRFNILYPHGPFDFLPWGFLLESKVLLEQILVPAGLLGIYYLSGYYNHPFPRSRAGEFLTTAGSVAVNSLIIFLIFLINDQTPMRRTEYFLIFILWSVMLFFTYLGRITVTTITLRKEIEKNREYTTVIIGNTRKSRNTASEIINVSSIYKNVILGYVPIEGEEDSFIEDDAVTMDRRRLREMCRNGNVNQIVVSPLSINDKIVLDIVDEFIDLDIPIKIAPDDLSFATQGIRLTDIMGYPLVDMTTPRLSDCAMNLKRSFDFLFSLSMLILLAPLLAAIAIGVKFSSPGPVFYSQERIGRRRKPFRIYKFRTMHTDAEKAGPALSSENDPRITNFGRILRKYRIDELPQLFNVLKGEMSIVGPRPEREFFIRQIVEKVPYFSLVHQVRPGITSWAMVKFGYASNLQEMVERTRYDMIYINNMSLLLDLKILIYTIKTVLGGMGK